MRGATCVNEADLRAIGAVEACARLKFPFGNRISLNTLHAMAAALTCGWCGLRPEKPKPGSTPKCGGGCSRPWWQPVQPQLSSVGKAPVKRATEAAKHGPEQHAGHDDRNGELV